MRKVLLTAATAVSLSACSTYYRPTPEMRIHIVDSPIDIRSCRRLGAVSGTVATSPGFETQVDAMLTATVGLGGTDLFLRRVSSDWAYVQGVAYRCPFERPQRVISAVVRARG
jgi:hypothetical protein